MKRLRIAQIAPPFISVPPKKYGGTELIVSYLTEDLVRRGHKVTLFASGDSQTNATLAPFFNSGIPYESMANLFSPLGRKLFWLHSLPAIAHVAAAYERAGEFDIIHDHTHYLGLLFSRLVKTPTIHTYHGNLKWARESYIEALLLNRYKDNNWVAISQSQKNSSTIPLNFVSVIPHGIAVNSFPYSAESGNYLVWIGRITQQKGLDDAIKVSRLTGKKFVISGIVNKRDNEYFEMHIKPVLHPPVEFKGPADHEKKTVLMGRAKAFIAPVKWEEPFGLVFIESLAVGTPVITYKRGALPEIIEDGVTGFLVEPSAGVKGLQKAVERLYSLSDEEYEQMRRNCRRHAEKYFSVARMTEKYEEAYEKVVSSI